MGTLFLALALTACSTSEPDLVRLRSDGPDEFSVLPGRELEIPTSMTALPPPTPGAISRTQLDPQANAIAALGGDPRALQAGAVPEAEAALVAGATRLGTEEGIRDALAAADLEHRRGRRGRPLERVFGTNVYNRAYRGQALDQYAELERFRRLGIRTVAAPPQDAAVDQ